MMFMHDKRPLTAALALGLAACSGSAKLDTENGLSVKAEQPLPLGTEQEADPRGSGGSRCDATAANREATEYDTSGDGQPDVRKVYLRLGIGDSSRLVMICRESDLNRDGKKDVIRYYDDEGDSIREDSDRNFDGRIDLSTAYEDNRVVFKEEDNNYDGVIDARIYFDNGQVVRAERDLVGRSGAGSFKPTRWEYYENGRMVRMGTDLDGDGKVDRWDRDDAARASAD